MPNAHTSILVGVTSPVLEIPLLSKTAKFPLQTMNYSPWSSKNLIDQNWLKKFMHVWIDVNCMCTDFGGRGLSSFGTLKNGQISLSDHGLNCCHKNEHKQGRVGLQAISVTPRPQPYTAVFCRSMMQDSMMQRLS